MNYLHKFNPPILHRDLKSLNVLIDAQYRAKLGDFGWTRQRAEYMTNKIGTFQWMAPEVIQGNSYNESADVFSFGIILWEITHKQPPYSRQSGNDVAKQVIDKHLRPKVDSSVPQELQFLMQKCWSQNPSQRLSFEEIVLQLEKVYQELLRNKGRLNE